MDQFPVLNVVAQTWQTKNRHQRRIQI